jgi:hypothetical protein
LAVAILKRCTHPAVAATKPEAEVIFNNLRLLIFINLCAIQKSAKFIESLLDVPNFSGFFRVFRGCLPKNWV